ncbi:TetR/AcrR family transcriptional regulator [Gordonia rhizosphera]|uniref:Putative TetR family transcriptional regulator n=1 Tax=Gordonia rhizosphera NBRC 16068 TaxID=1108045 RepID=K6VU06_9ACTN|nr:TetR/AcrR family transcriptional regulator [Gordonia rhizosphera]GAB90365.1 putative TetR family transcriptional regulator [Gordonia rhizosphera NBRC 16068]
MATTESGTKIMSSTLELLRSGGPDAVTIESVAKHSGVARTTIYRRYRNREEMLTDALVAVGVPDPPPPDMPGEQRMRWVIRRSAAMVFDGIGCGGFAALLTDTDPEFSTLFRRVLATHRRVLENVLEEGIAAGTIRHDLDPDTLIDGVVGALVAERARTGTIAPGWEERAVDTFRSTVLP